MDYQADLHYRAAQQHEEAAIRHDKSAEFWRSKDNIEQACFEERNARIERDAAQLERDRGAYLKRERADTGPDG